jgi:spermidine/putrescine transport system substrate-binding protein
MDFEGYRPRYRRLTPITRRQFLRRSAGAAIALPSLSAILAACSKPGTTANGGGPSGSGLPYQLARPDHPVTLPLHDDIPAIADGLQPEQNATVQLYNWDAYMWKFVLGKFDDQYDTNYEWTTFESISGEAAQKLSSGQVKADVFWPTVDYMGKMVAAKLFRPLNHSYIPNLPNNVWPSFQNPFYDQGWLYSVPYTIYTTGIGYRRDHISDDEVATKGWDIFWDPKYKGKTGIYDDYREAISLALLRNGITDLNTADPSALDKAKADLLELISSMDIRATINGAYAKLPEDEFWLHQAWSGDMVGAQWYLPKGVSTDVLGFWWPEDGKGPIGNDTMVVLAGGQNPVLAHLFLNFMLDEHWAVKNFSWNGYQPPLTSLNPDNLIGQGYVPQTLDKAIVRQEDFDRGLFELELTPADDQKWQDVWDEFKAGA